MTKRMDYAEYGGAPLLGINGVGIVSHGRSNAKAIRNAITVANRFVETRVNDLIQAQLAAQMGVGS
jgi:glycerol-3-phosphate acyltransferase PlsX